jgi:hypothetical protein
MQKIDLAQNLDSVASARLTIKQWRLVLRVLQADMHENLDVDRVDCFIRLSDQFENCSAPLVVKR